MIDCVVSPVDHKLPVAEEEVKVTEPPSQNVVGPPAVITGTTGFGFTVTFVVEAEGVEQPNPFATSTEYAPEVVTVIDCVVSPVDHKYELAVLEVNVTEPPSQKVIGPLAVIVGAVGFGFTVMLVVALTGLSHPLASVISTLYEPVVVTVMDCVVAPFDHK